MNWYELYGEIKQPSLDNIKDFINNSLWDDLRENIENIYKVKPIIEYSKCSAQKGWNVKYKKSGKSLCTLYPMDGYFIALIIIGEKQQQLADLVITSCDDYIQNLYRSTPFSLGGKWLMIEVKSKNTYEDVLKLIDIRANTNLQ